MQKLWPNPGIITIGPTWPSCYETKPSSRCVPDSRCKISGDIVHLTSHIPYSPPQMQCTTPPLRRQLGRYGCRNMRQTRSLNSQSQLVKALRPGTTANMPTSSLWVCDHNPTPMRAQLHQTTDANHQRVETHFLTVNASNLHINT
jgi:hypothetical protein